MNWPLSIVPEDPAQDPGYWASVEAEASLSADQWRALEARETGRPAPASAQARAAAGSNLLWSIRTGWDEAEIPTRPWIARGYLMRGAVTVLSGPGSAGKSSLVCAWAAALTLGRDYHAMRLTAPARVIVYNVEDDASEQQRRMSAALRQFDATPYSADGNLIIVGPNRVGTLLTMNRDGSLLVNTPVMDELDEMVAEFRPDVIFLDPFVELHDAEENDNTAVRAVMARLRSIATLNKCSVCVLHHSRKGVATPGDPDSLRGASAIVGAARVALTINIMTDEEAAAFGLPKDTRRNYFRLDGAKSNYAPIHDAEWFERVEHQLDNSDGVAAATPWTPPAPDLRPEIMDAIERAIERGTPTGPYSPRLSDMPSSIAAALKGHGIIGKAAQKGTIAALMRTGRVVEAHYRRPRKTEPGVGLKTRDGKPEGVDWL
jgi:hypothetical protein